MAMRQDFVCLFRSLQSHHKASRSQQHKGRLSVEPLEGRVLLAGTWTNLAPSAGSAPPDGGAMLMLLSNGSILVQDGINPTTSAGQSTFTLAPQANTGSYVNGVWSATGSMNENRLFFTTAMLPDGRVFAVGGEYPKFSNTAEIYDPTTGVWTSVDSAPTLSTNIDLSGTVTGASNANPIVITTGSTQALQNGMQVTIAGVNGNTAANGTWTVSGLTSTTFKINSDGTSSGTFINDGKGSWNAYTPQFGDDPIEVVSGGPNNGQILAGYFFDQTTYRFNPGATAGSQWTQTAVSSGTTPGKLHSDKSDEEAWVKLKDGSILSYDIYASASSGTFQAQRYNPATDQWVDASNLSPTNPPSVLSGSAQGYELGPAFLQPDGNVIYFGANGNTAIYNPTTNIWTAGFNEPQKNLTITPDAKQNHYKVTAGGSATYLVGTDDPGAMLPNGHILISLSPLGPLKSNGSYSFPEASYLYEYDPTATTAAAAFTEVTPGGLSNVNAFQLNMVVLPTGQVLLANEGNPFQVYTEDPTTGPQNGWRPTITSIVQNSSGGSTYTLTGTQLNGISEGANYGDDNESASNYPIIQFTDSSGNVSYGRTFNWSSTGVATGSTPVTTEFTLPAGHTSLSDFTTVTVIANGIPSLPVPALASPNVMAPSKQFSAEGASQSFNLGSFVDPSGSAWAVDVNWGDGTSDTTFSASPGSLGTQSHTYGEEGNYTPTVTVTDTTDKLSGSASFPVAVSDPAVVEGPAVAVSAVEGAAFTSSVATFTDPGGAEPNSFDKTPGISSHYTVASIDWGDGTPLDTSTGTISFIGTPGSKTDVFTVGGSHIYGEEGTYTVTAIIDHEGVDTSLTDTATVSDPAVIATGVPVYAVECQALSGVTVATFTDPGGAEPNSFDKTPGISSHYTVASIDWGDGTPLDTSTGTISFIGIPGSKTDAFTVSGSHTYMDEGTYTVTAIIDHEGVMTTVSTTATIKDDLGLLLLDPTGSQSLMVTGNGNVDVTGICGAVVVDSNNTKAVFVSGNGVVTAGDFDVTGGVSTSGKGVVPNPVDHEAPTTDPLLGLGLPSPLPPPPVGNTATVFHPGTYVGGLKFSGKAAVTLLPGVYVMNGGGFSVSGQASVTGSGVVIINAPSRPSDTIDVSGQGTVNLSAPTSGRYQGVAVLQNPASGNPVSFSGQASVTITGVVYVPAAPVNISGGAVVTINFGPGTATLPPILGALVAYDLQASGNGALIINPDDPPSGPMKVAGSVAADVHSAALVALMSGGGLSSSGTTNDQTAIDQVAIGLAGNADLFSSTIGGAKKKDIGDIGVLANLAGQRPGSTSEISRTPFVTPEL